MVSFIIETKKKKVNKNGRVNEVRKKKRKGNSMNMTLILKVPKLDLQILKTGV